MGNAGSTPAPVHLIRASQRSSPALTIDADDTDQGVSGCSETVVSEGWKLLRARRHHQRVHLVVHC